MLILNDAALCIRHSDIYEAFAGLLLRRDIETLTHRAAYAKSNSSFLTLGGGLPSNPVYQEDVTRALAVDSGVTSRLR
jgi:hypothetical protein